MRMSTNTTSYRQSKLHWPKRHKSRDIYGIYIGI